MQAPKRYEHSNKSQKSYYPHNSMPVREAESHLLPQNHQSLNYVSSDDGSNQRNVHPHTSGQFCTLESSSAAAGYATHNSPSSLAFSPNSGSPLSQQECQSDNTYGSPLSVSCITEDPNDLKLKLRELETAMLGPDSDIVESFESTYPSHTSLDPEKWRQVMGIPRGDLKQMLIACARAVAENDIPVVEWLTSELRQMVSVSGEPIQRVGAYMLEGLVARLASTGSSIYKALRCKEPTSSELLSYMHVLYEVCPYFKFGYMSANGAIAEALKGENMVHIIDFQIAQGSQWVTLIQALAARPGGPPHVRITGIDDSVSAYARGGGLHIVGQRLSRLAQSCNVPFEFHAAAISGSDVELEHLGVQPGEALAVNFAFQLHHMPDESVSTRNHRDRLLRMVKSLSPKVVALVEQESNTNTAPFFPRFLETLDYYTAIFESLDVTLARENKERISVEQHCLARDIVNVIACEGAERVERHELFGKWRSRFTMAGFKPCPLSPLVNATIKTLLENYCEHYRLEERDGVLYLGWKNRALVVSCAWR
ncbi:chitin-inducible gibberellin-responsive protein 2-like [Phoenix dactylifera]|uniref:Chitin-inducible gibberellin-responsive protein 2-like n=1 Tax=Phoenix dactylifera TaxID=42345 RepID=A0A8B9AJA6_PHODC|nr:chitin-inducible gibberellin-responsive protein 2-like [Phoenix dactylifera]XP_038983358.1 chitin-inducible gibberellin-responsive protein 2-like [Phoenix dactylifera]XP_038983359.1 chitin-inducible gibberellin-responsive protein 2-like [Phoenix dactylifera]XP_038983360.1 chitin-inducible gibberellin-responsive protein 2-like [Phoenix dactylifera]XP_038983362.1 chitin-inducible gibberellin-responsive protein 2-like [Phoenix dactylifera]